jgi:hypothetical protein
MDSPTKEEIEYYDKLYRITPYNRREDVWYRAYLEAVEALQEVRESINGMDEWHIQDFDIRNIDEVLEKAPEEEK